jgi:predicted nuclease of predicted toxin-antitoxin system
VRLFLDEQISPVVSSRLREQGFNVVSPHDLGTCGGGDLDQFAWSAADGRAIVTYNVADFRLLADQYLSRGQNHFGLILVSERTMPQRDLGALLRALEALLITYPGDVALLNQTVFLQAVPS